MAGGNYYWVELHRDKAVSYYQRILDEFPAGKDAYNAEWRIAWVAYLDRQPFADDKMTIFLRKYPVSPAAVNALYWLGRDAERERQSGACSRLLRKSRREFSHKLFRGDADKVIWKNSGLATGISRISWRKFRRPRHCAHSTNPSPPTCRSLESRASSTHDRL